MYYTHILRSCKNGDIYIGSTNNLKNRIKQHNSGKVRSTKGYTPWELLEYKEFEFRSDAMKNKYFLKSGQQKEILRKKYGHVAKG